MSVPAPPDWRTVLDKTGTVTEGRMVLSDIVAPGDNGSLLLRLAGSLESRSEHPIAAAISAASATHDPVDSFENRPGFGVVGSIDGVEVRVGRRLLFDHVPDEVEAAAERAERAGSTAVLTGRGGAAEAVLVVDDRIKDTSVDAVAALHEQGLKVTLLTGDHVGPLEGVQGVVVDVEGKVVTVTGGDPAAIVAAIDDAGYDVA